MSQSVSPDCTTYIGPADGLPLGTGVADKAEVVFGIGIADKAGVVDGTEVAVETRVAVGVRVTVGVGVSVRAGVIVWAETGAAETIRRIART